MTVSQQVFRDSKHPATGASGYDLLVITASSREMISSFCVKASQKMWQVAACADEQGVLSATLYKPSGKVIDWHDPGKPALTGELGRAIDSALASERFAQRQRHRIAMGEVYVMCMDCGGKLWSDDALPGEKEDRAIPCPSKDKITGKCGI